jgi:ATP-dependent helicase IRC3
VDMINDGWLSDVLFTTVRLKNTDLSKVSIGKSGDFLASSLARAVNTSLNNEAAVGTWFDRCSDRKSTLIFCVDVAHVHELTAGFRRRNLDARFVTGKTTNNVRAHTIDAFKRGEFPILLNCGVFTEGTDIPNIDCVLLARPTKSRNLLVQMIGRGMRLSPGKQNCHVIDMVTSLKTGIVTTPTLYGLDPDELVESATEKDLQDLQDRRQKEQLAQSNLSSENIINNPISLTYTDYGSINDLIEDTMGERHIRQFSRYSWVQVGADDFVLSSSNRGFLRIQRQDDHFQVKYTAKLHGGRSPYARQRDIITHTLTLEDAVHGADKFAEKSLRPLTLIENYARWRRVPATEAQIAFLNKFRIEENKLKSNSISKGQAVDMITKIKFGARGRFGKITAAKKKAEKDGEKLRRFEEMRQREVVREGPLPFS